MPFDWGDAIFRLFLASPTDLDKHWSGSFSRTRTNLVVNCSCMFQSISSVNDAQPWCRWWRSCKIKAINNIIGSFGSHDSDGEKHRQKKQLVSRAKQQPCTSITLHNTFLGSQTDYDLKFLVRLFMVGLNREQQILLSFLFTIIWQTEWVEITLMKFKEREYT